MNDQENEKDSAQQLPKLQIFSPVYKLRITTYSKKILIIHNLSVHMHLNALLLKKTRFVNLNHRIGL